MKINEKKKKTFWQSILYAVRTLYSLHKWGDLISVRVSDEAKMK